MMMMQPPPRKVNESQQVKQVFSEQISKLQNKQQQDTDLLEEIRSFSKHRATIEKDYGQALQRLAVQYQKRDWQRGNTDAINPGSVFSVWRSVVDATAQSAASRLAAAEEYRSLIGQASRSLRDAKELRAKKGLEGLQRAQGEVLEVLRELHRVKKSYKQLSHICATARDKAADAHARAKKSDHGIFHFRSGLNKLSTNWLDTRLKECDDRLTEVRNEYLLSLAAINSHHHYYYNTDLKHVMENMDGDVYEQLRAHFTQLCETEASVCLSTQRQYRHIGDTAAKVTRERNVVQFFQESVSFNKTPEICFHPGPQDKVCVLQEVCSAPGGEGSLDNEARKWASKAAKDYKIISHGERALPTLESRVKLLSGETGLSMERKISEVEESVRKAKVSRVRAEARLALLSQSGVGAEQCLRAAMSHAQDELERERRLSQQRRATEDFSEEDEFELTDLEDYADDSGDIFVDPSSSSTPPGVYVYPAPCRVIYNYQASQSDELSITEGEELQVVEDGDVEDWLKACNSCGQVGYVPERYVQFMCVPVEGAAQLDGSFSSGSSSSAGHMTRTKRTGVARALYTYQAQSPDELSFNEGAIIHLLRYRRGQVDDGYWEGELDGRMGVFPSLVVERLLVETQEEEEEEEEDAAGEEEEEEALPTPTLPSFSPPIPISTPNAAGYCSAHSTPPPPSGVEEDALLAVSGAQHRVTDSRAESAGSEHSSPDLSNRQLRPCRAPPPPPTQRFSPVQ